MNEREYRIWAAATHEVLRLLCDRRPSLRHNTIVKALLKNTRPDWVQWKTAVAMREVDEWIAEMHHHWDEEHAAANAPVITETPPDGSKAQELLGGELRIQAPWTIEKP